MLGVRANSRTAPFLLASRALRPLCRRASAPAKSKHPSEKTTGQNGLHRNAVCEGENRRGRWVAGETCLSLRPMVLRSVASVICFAPAVIFCLSGGTPVRAKSCQTPTRHHEHAHLTVQRRAKPHALASPRLSPRCAERRTEAKREGMNLRLKKLSRLTQLHVDVILVLEPLDFHRNLRHACVCSDRAAALSLVHDKQRTISRERARGRPRTPCKSDFKVSMLLTAGT